MKWTVGVMDVLGDGNPEIVGANQDGTTYIFDSELNVLAQEPVFGFVDALNDLDGDGQVEIVMHDDRVLFVLGDDLVEEAYYTFESDISKAVVADPDADGINEIICVGEWGMTVLDAR